LSDDLAQCVAAAQVVRPGAFIDAVGPTLFHSLGEGDGADSS
jgi:hypothetical protein